VTNDPTSRNSTHDEIGTLLADAAPEIARSSAYARPPRQTGIKAAFARLLGPGEHSAEEMVVEGARFDHWLKKIFGRVILLVVIAQIISANVLIFFHMAFGFGAGVESTVIIAWISGTVVESIGLMAIVTSYLFPANKPGK
jgi:hypothetical protein